MYETDKIILPLSEERQDLNKLDLELDSKKIIIQIKDLLSKLEDVFENEFEFEEVLKLIHGRFSKVELNLIELEKIKNESI